MNFAGVIFFCVIFAVTAPSFTGDSIASFKIEKKSCVSREICLMIKNRAPVCVRQRIYEFICRSVETETEEVKFIDSFKLQPVTQNHRLGVG